MLDHPNTISKTFCGYAFKQLHVTPMGVVKPCCIFDGPIKNNNGETQRISDGNIENIWNNEHFVSLRQKMLRGEAIPECIKCMEEERVSNSSDRTHYGYVNEDVKKRIDEAKANDGVIKTLPNYLNVKIGNVCNLKCRMCQPLDSCMVDAEFTEISKEEPRFRNFDNANAFDYNYDLEPIEVAANWIVDSVAKNNIYKIVDNIVHLALAGGEVTFTPQAMDLLKYCNDKNLSKNIDLFLSSNVTKASDEFINLISHFKDAFVIVSIDGIEKVGEYIRYPSKWNTVYSNYQKLLNGPENIYPILSPTVQIYNILSIVDVLEILENNRHPKWENGQRQPAHLVVLFAPDFLSIRHLPRKIKEIAFDRIKNFYDKSHFVKNHYIYRNELILLMKILKEDSDPVNSPVMLQHFLKYTEMLDKSRNQKMEFELPELFELLKSENIVSSFPKETSDSFTFYRYRDLGFTLKSQNKIKEAMLMFEKGYELNPLDIYLLFNFGLCHKDLQNSAAAEKYFKEAHAIDPDYYYPLIELGLIAAEKKNYGDAKAYFLKAQITEPLEEAGKAQRFLTEFVKG